MKRLGIEKMQVSERDQRALALLNVCGITLDVVPMKEWVVRINEARETIDLATANGLPMDAQLVRDHKEFYGI